VEQPSLTDLLRSVNDVFDSLGTLWRQIRAYRRVAVRGWVLMSPDLPRSGHVVVKVRDDQPAPIELVFHDAEGAVTTQLPEGATVQLTTDNAALATAAVNPDGRSGALNVTPGWDSQPIHIVHVQMTAPFTSDPSDDVEIDPTVATSGSIVLHATV
jgi:hypothetical protein